MTRPYEVTHDHVTLLLHAASSSTLSTTAIRLSRPGEAQTVAYRPHDPASLTALGTLLLEKPLAALRARHPRAADLNDQALALSVGWEARPYAYPAGDKPGFPMRPETCGLVQTALDLYEFAARDADGYERSLAKTFVDWLRVHAFTHDFTWMETLAALAEAPEKEA